MIKLKIKYGNSQTDIRFPCTEKEMNAEAAAKGNWTGTADEIADKIANGFKNSAGHWRYVGSAEYTYMAVGITYKGGTWYCCV